MSLKTYQRSTKNDSYKVIILDKRTEKNFAALSEKFRKPVWNRMLDFLKHSPNQGKKVMQFRKYNLPNANRILYIIIDSKDKKAVQIVCAGDHNEYERCLNKYGSKK